MSAARKKQKNNDTHERTAPAQTKRRKTMAKGWHLEQEKE
jgi:hypothetical protein